MIQTILYNQSEAAIPTRVIQTISATFVYLLPFQLLSSSPKQKLEFTVNSNEIKLYKVIAVVVRPHPS